MESGKLRIGVMLDSYELPAWAFLALDRVMQLDCTELCLIVLNENSNIHGTKIRHIWKNRNQLAYHLFDRIDRWIFRRDPDAFEPKNIESMLAGTPVIKVRPIRKKYSDYFPPADVDKIREYRLDIMIRMGFRILRGDVLKSAKHGIWSHHHGDNRKKRGGPPGFWEVIEGIPETGSILQILTEELDGGIVLYRSWSCTYPLSPSRNRSFYYWTSASFLSRQIERLHALGEARFYEAVEKYNGHIEFNDHKLYRVPSNISMVAISLRLLARICAKAYQRIFHREQWCLMFDLNDDISPTLRNYKKLLPPKDRFWADPHAVKKDGKYYIFIEEYLYRTKRPHISVLEMDERGNWKEPVPVLRKEYHLAYPFVFQWQGAFYMVPESQQNRTIELYVCSGFPHEWKFLMYLMEDVMAVDTTLLHHDGKWWLFTGMRQTLGAPESDELYLFHSDDLLTKDWKPHLLNPVVSDVRKARPAGKIFRRNGRIIRPSMDCSFMYGHGFNLNEITCLSETEYREETLGSVKPKWDPRIVAAHTFTREGNLNIIDALRVESRYC